MMSQVVQDTIKSAIEIRDGLITRLAIHHDLSPIRVSRQERRVRPNARTAGPVVNGQQCNRAVGPRAG